jgi:putative protease
VYHRAIEDAAAGREFDMGMMDELEGLSNRGFTEGFYRRHPPKEYQNYEQGASTSDRQQLVGELLDINDRWLTVDVKNRFFTGDLMELVMPSGNVTFDLAEMQNKDDQTVDVAPGSGHVVKIPVPDEVDINSVDEFAMLVRYLPRDE